MVRKKTISSSSSGSHFSESGSDSEEPSEVTLPPPPEIKVTKKKQRKIKKKGRKKRAKIVEEEEFVIDDWAFYSSIKEQIWTQDLFEEELFQKKVRKDLESEGNMADGELKETEKRKLLMRLLIVEKRYSNNFKKAMSGSGVWMSTKGKFKGLKQILEKKEAYGNELGSYGSIDSGISVRPQIKYWDFTGFRGKYTDKHTGLRFYDLPNLKYADKISEETKNQYLEIRKALKTIT